MDIFLLFWKDVGVSIIYLFFTNELYKSSLVSPPFPLPYPGGIGGWSTQHDTASCHVCNKEFVVLTLNWNSLSRVWKKTNAQKDKVNNWIYIGKKKLEWC